MVLFNFVGWKFIRKMILYKSTLSHLDINVNITPCNNFINGQNGMYINIDGVKDNISWEKMKWDFRERNFGGWNLTNF